MVGHGRKRFVAIVFLRTYTA